MASPARPRLASAIYAGLSPRGALDSVGHYRRLTTLRSAIDRALGNGLTYGAVSCINGDAESGAYEICTAFLVSHLLSSPDAMATIFDCANSFDVRRLHRAIEFDMQSQKDSAHHAMVALDRVKIMKVFDFVGLRECESELSRVLESNESPSTSPISQERGPEGTIRDSEDEEETLDLATDPPKQSRPPAATTPQSANPCTHLLLIDNLSHVTAPMIKNLYAQGQAELACFMRSLNYLTKAHNLGTIILNGVALSHNNKDEPPSTFSSCTLRPALGRSFSHMLDTNLLVHLLRRSNSHQRMSSDRGGDEQGLVSVMEVLHDRHGENQGQWAPFRVDDAGRLVSLT